MLVTQYFHRLPAGHDMAQIRDRAATRGPDWDHYPDLVFKGFLGRERGRFGATANGYSSLYLWQRAEAIPTFLASERFRAVTDSFGRPQIESWTALDARAGRARHARSAYREEQDIPVDADLPAVLADEQARNRAMADRPEIFASVVALDLQAWRLVRFTLSADEPKASATGTAYEVLYLAKPNLASLA